MRSFERVKKKNNVFMTEFLENLDFLSEIGQIFFWFTSNRRLCRVLLNDNTFCWWISKQQFVHFAFFCLYTLYQMTPLQFDGECSTYPSLINRVKIRFISKFLKLKSKLFSRFFQQQKTFFHFIWKKGKWTLLIFFNSIEPTSTSFKFKLIFLNFKNENIVYKFL